MDAGLRKSYKFLLPSLTATLSRRPLRVLKLLRGKLWPHQWCSSQASSRTMHARLASLLLVASAVILSFVSTLAGGAVVPIFRTAIHAETLAELSTFIPVPTLFISDHQSLVVVLLATVCLLSLVAVWRLPEQVHRCVAGGLCMQWMVVWGTAFCLCYDGFLGPTSMHHPRWFEFDQFLTLARGVFPISLVLIVLPLIVALWPTRASRHDHLI